MMWIELTTSCGDSTWINVERVVEITRMKDDDGREITRLFTGHVATTPDGTVYYYMDVTEYPAQIVEAIMEATQKKRIVVISPEDEAA